MFGQSVSNAHNSMNTNSENTTQTLGFAFDNLIECKLFRHLLKIQFSYKIQKQKTAFFSKLIKPSSQTFAVSSASTDRSRMNSRNMAGLSSCPADRGRTSRQHCDVALYTESCIEGRIEFELGGKMCVPGAPGTRQYGTR
jgi:hypothetical protein